MIAQLLTGIETSVIVFHQNIRKESRASLFCGKSAFSSLEIEYSGFFYSRTSDIISKIC